MFNDLIDKWEERISDAAATAGSTAIAYAERIIARLDGIQEAVTNQAFDNRTEDFEQTVTAAAPATLTVPAGEDWRLVYLASSVDTVITVRHGSRLRGRWDTAKPPQSPGLLLRGNSEFTLGVSVDAELYAQFEVEVPKVARRTKLTGMPALVPDGQNTVDENVGRHGPGSVTRHPIRPTGNTPNQ